MHQRIFIKIHFHLFPNQCDQILIVGHIWKLQLWICFKELSEGTFWLIEWWCLKAQGRSPGRRELTQGVTLVASSGLRVQNSTAPSTIALRWGGGCYRASCELRDAVIQLTPEFGKNKFQTQSCIFLLTLKRICFLDLNLFFWLSVANIGNFWTFFFTRLWNWTRWEKGGGHDSRLGPRSGFLREEQYSLI